MSRRHNVAIALGAVALTLTGVFFYWRQRQSPMALLAVSAGNRRSFIWRVPGANYAPIDNTRGAKDRDPAWLEAALRLTQNHEDLRARGRLALLDEKADQAVRELSQAQLEQAPTVETYIDLGIAYALRAEANRNGVDRLEALEAFSRAIRLSPKDSTAKFNRALVNEKLRFWRAASDDWRAVIALESRLQWRQEAQAGLSRAQAALAASDAAGWREKSKDLNEERLARLMTGTEQDPAVAQETARRFQVELADGFARALLSGREAALQNGHPVGDTLRRMASVRLSGNFEGYGPLRPSVDAIANLSLSGYAAAWRAYEFAFWSIRTAREECPRWTSEAVERSHRLHAVSLEAQSLTELSYCSVVRGQQGPAEEALERVLTLAPETALPEARLRAIAFLADYRINEGSYALALRRVDEALRLATAHNLPLWLQLNPFGSQIRVTENLGLHEAGAIACWEQAESARRIGWRRIEMNERIFAALEWREAGGDPRIEGQVRRARELHKEIREGGIEGMARWSTDASIALAGRDAAELERLRNFAGGEISWRIKLGNELADLHWRSGDRGAAARVARQTIELLRLDGAQPQNLRLRAPLAAAFATVRNERIEAADARGAWDAWQRGRAEDNALLRFQPPPDVKPDEDPQALRLGLFRTPNRIFVLWRWQGQDGIHRIETNPDDWLRRARLLERLCANRETPTRHIDPLAASLGAELLAPILKFLPAASVLTIETDPSLAGLPFSVLRTGNRYLIEHVAVSHRLRAAPSAAQFRPIDSALLMGASVLSPRLRESFPELTGLEEELQQVGSRLRQPTLLLGASVNRRAIEKAWRGQDLVHFSGHAGQLRGEAVLLIAPGADGDGEQWLAPTGLTPAPRLAVLAACETAAESSRLDSGLASLAERFLKAGSELSVATQWQLDNRTATVFLDAFYQSLRSGKSPHQSLRTAAMQLIAKDSTPFYWASFQTYI